jgi:hypothetical protein
MTQRRQLNALARNRSATAGAGTLFVGLPQDYQTVHKKSREGYELFLHDLLLNNLGKDLTPQLGITFHSLDSRHWAACERRFPHLSPLPPALRERKPLTGVIAEKTASVRSRG